MWEYNKWFNNQYDFFQFTFEFMIVFKVSDILVFLAGCIAVTYLLDYIWELGLPLTLLAPTSRGLNMRAEKQDKV